MKTILLLAILLPLKLLSQIPVRSKVATEKFLPCFLGEDYRLYKGVYFKVNDEVAADFNYTFYSDLEDIQTSKVLYPDAKYNFQTVKDSLVNRIFKVEGFTIHKSDIGNSYDKLLFLLRDTLSQQMIYFVYDSTYDFNFPFNTTKVNIPEALLCSRIDREVDDFTKEIKLASPTLSSSGISPIKLIKYIKKTTVYYLSLTTHGSTVNVNGTGATILFTNGTQWTKPVKIDVDAGKDGFEYSAFITLSLNDLTTLATKAIKKFRLYIYDQDISLVEAQKINIYVKCLQKAN